MPADSHDGLVLWVEQQWVTLRASKWPCKILANGTNISYKIASRRLAIDVRSVQ